MFSGIEIKIRRTYTLFQNGCHCFIANWSFWPRLRLNILLNFTFEREAKSANFQGKAKCTVFNVTMAE